MFLDIRLLKNTSSTSLTGVGVLVWLTKKTHSVTPSALILAIFLVNLLDLRRQIKVFSRICMYTVGMRSTRSIF